MLPHPARPAKKAKGAQPPRPRQGAKERRTPDAEAPAAFVPPLAPSPPPGTPPTVHTRTAAPELAPSRFSPAPAARTAAFIELDAPVRAGARARTVAGAEAGGSAGSGAGAEAGAGGNLGGGAEAVAGAGAGAGGNLGGSAGANSPGNPNSSGTSPKAPAPTIRRVAVTLCTASAAAAAFALTGGPDGLSGPSGPADSIWQFNSIPQISHGPGNVLDPAASLLGLYPAFWLVWVLVLAAAAWYAVWQWFPSQRSNPRQKWTGPISAGSAVLTALWLWAVQTGNPAAAFWLAVLQVGLGLAAIHLANAWPSGSHSETAAADLPAAVFLGASTIALLAGMGNWLTARETSIAGWSADAWTLIALMSAVIGIITVCMTDRGHLATALTVLTGLAGIGFARLFTELPSMPAAAGAFMGGFLVLVSAGSRRHQVDHAQRRRQREWLKAEATAPAAAEAPEAVRT